MNRRHHQALACLIFVLLVSLLGSSAHASVSVSVSFTKKDADLGDALLLGAAALFFGMDSDVSLQYRSQTGSATSTVSLFYVAAESQSVPDVIVAERKRGNAWGALAKGKKIPPGLVGKWKSGKDPFALSDRDFETGLNVRFLTTYYAVPEDSVVIWLNRGISVPDLALCLNLATRARVAPDVIVSARLKGNSWTQLSTRYKVSLELIGQPVAPKAKHAKKVPGAKSQAGKSKNKK